MKGISSEISRKFEVNYRPDYTVKHRVIWRDSTWNIHDVQPSEDRFDTRLFVSRIQ